jgi:Zn-dependent protease
MTQAAPPTTFPCPHCGNPITDGQLVCANCNGLVYSQRLQQLANEAIAHEHAGDQIGAATIWEQTLALLPRDSIQFRDVATRIAALTGGTSVLTYATPTPRPNDPLGVAIAKTVGSMVISIIVYTWMFSDPFGLRFGAEFATGFVILMLIHEMGHVFAMRYYRLSASPPIFIPFLGALINLRQPPRNALEEAIVGIGGPVVGTIGATIAFVIAQWTRSPLMLELAEWGFLLNLFNMLPVPPLDGGRVTAAVSPWIWLPGLGAVVGRIAWGFFHGGYVNPILILLLIFAWPRVRKTLIERSHDRPYYQIGLKATWAMGTAYALLGIYLAVMYYLPSILTVLQRMGWIQIA